MFKVCPLQTVYKGEPYVGSRSEELTVKNKCIQDLEKEVKQLKAQVFHLKIKGRILQPQKSRSHPCLGH